MTRSPKKHNYALLMEQELERIAAQKSTGTQVSLLLHACCAPCSSHVIETLAPHFDRIAIYYYNPNIHPRTEYRRRLEELKTFLAAYESAARVTLEQAPYIPDEYFSAAGTLADERLQTEPERGERCRRCYRFRMERAFRFALEHRFSYVATTLSISPHKDAEAINSIGKELEAHFMRQSGGGAPRYLYADFKKHDGFKRSLELSAQYGLYRQQYCGCIYSLRNAGGSSRGS